MSGSIGFRRAALHLGGIWALAFAQPLLDLLGRNAQFFVARGSTTGDILLLAFGYVLVPPLVGAGIVWGLGSIRPALGWGAMLALVALIVAGLALPPTGDLLGGSPLAIPVALLLGAGAAALYARAAGVRSFVTLLSPAPAIVLLLFLVASPVRGVLFPSEASGSVAGPSRSATPIVHIVLDELPQSTLADADGKIDAGLFPNFARLARQSTWYRNATTVDDLTTEAVPAQLTGEQPQAGSLPTTRDHPRSLFTLFEHSHRLTVIEPITDLCPARLCEDVRPGVTDRLRSLESDLEVVVQHLLLPEDLRDGLPAIDRVWEGFEARSVAGAGELRGGANLKRDVLARLARDDATAGFERAIASLERPGSRPPLLFVHSTLPHGPWRFLPDGREYPIEGVEYPGLASKGWIGPQWQVDQGFQRHVLQVQYIDRLVGRLLDRLRVRGLFDDAVIVVTADHGASFVTGQPRRPASRANSGAIAPVPLFVKSPGQREGRVDDRSVRTMDVLPTIAKAAGVRLPWKADGIPADERAVDPGAPIDVSHAGEPALTEPLGSVLAKRRARERVEARLLRRGVYAIGPRPELLGRRVDAGSGGRQVTVDHEAAVLPSFVSGRAEGLAADAELAVAVNGRVEGTTRVYRDGGHPVYAALVPPSSLRDGTNAVTVLQVLPRGELRPLG
ncbi:MAG TPA: sulfatase-like hydrolase/transferase [Solirubrobacteraceae bacterium]|nr:sulfatase-like hydrolase/transferase [Solirubrobacteraceae bacterium]